MVITDITDTARVRTTGRLDRRVPGVAAVRAGACRSPTGTKLAAMNNLGHRKMPRVRVFRASPSCIVKAVRRKIGPIGINARSGPESDLRTQN